MSRIGVMPYELIQYDDYLLTRFSGTLTAADFLSMASEAEPIEAQRTQVNRILDLARSSPSTSILKVCLRTPTDGLGLCLRRLARQRSSLPGRSRLVWPGCSSR